MLIKRIIDVLGLDSKYSMAVTTPTKKQLWVGILLDHPPVDK